MPFEISTHVAALDLNTHLFFNALRGLDEAEAGYRIAPQVNSAAFVAAHLVDARHYLLKMLGVARPNPMDAFGQARSEDEVRELPSLALLREAWLDVAGALRQALLALTPEVAARPAGGAFLMMPPGLIGAVVFLLHHESYHVGQIALLRKHLGHEAMTYTPAPEVPAWD